MSRLTVLIVCAVVLTMFGAYRVRAQDAATLEARVTTLEELVLSLQVDQTALSQDALPPPLELPYISPASEGIVISVAAQSGPEYVLGLSCNIEGARGADHTG